MSAEGRRREALGLSYERGGDSAPRVVARGSGDVAERILEVAREHGVPIREDPDLVHLLGAVDLGDEVPREVFAAVAELLAALYRLNAAEVERRPGHTD